MQANDLGLEEQEVGEDGGVEGRRGGLLGRFVWISFQESCSPLRAEEVRWSSVWFTIWKRGLALTGLPQMLLYWGTRLEEHGI